MMSAPVRGEAGGRCVNAVRCPSLTRGRGVLLQRDDGHRITSPPQSGQQHVVLHDVSWDLYQHLLAEVGDGALRMTFDNGSLEIMSPLPKHELWKKRIGRMIEIVSLELDIPMESLGSTTFARQDLQKGLEPDECYYIQARRRRLRER